MSLLGRLEDLSLTDIIQIVFLSRRTGVLEIVDDRGRHTVLFRQGLVVNASAPEHPDLVTFLEINGAIPATSAKMLRQMETSGIPYGTAVMELNLLSKDDLAGAILKRILHVVTPLAQSREGEFNFILSDSMNALDVEYEPDVLFKEGGFAPQKILAAGEGEKLKPLRGLEESLKAGKALLRGATTAESTPAALNLGLGQPVAAPPPQVKLPGTAPNATDNVVPFPAQQQPAFAPVEAPPPPPLPPPPPRAAPEPPPQQQRGSGQFKVAGGLFEVESPEALYRNVVLFERNPLVRVAAKRAFTKQGTKIAQFGSLDDVRVAMTELFRSNSFFVTFLELTSDDASVRLMQQLKRKNARLPVVLIDAEADLRRRHDLLRGGADLYLTKPTPARLQPGLAEEELALFADELVLFAERAFQNWEQITGGGAEAGKRFYELGSKETIDRSFSILKQLINELSNPNDIGQVSSTILRLSAQYLDRGALFVANERGFTGLGGFGVTGDGDAMDARVRALSLPRDIPSVLADVAASGAAHHGKMRRTPTNIELIERLGGQLPTEVVALPILHANRTIGILYGDNAEHRAPIDSMTGLEIFLSQAGYAFGNAVFASEKAGRGREGL
ncbi:MAG TPA: response regulator [Thermoanaerobaculia bacterium]|nr:response regulator [Thermoanaerobaculia bacterium]